MIDILLNDNAMIVDSRFLPLQLTFTPDQSRKVS